MITRAKISAVRANSFVLTSELRIARILEKSKDSLPPEQRNTVTLN